MLRGPLFCIGVICGLKTCRVFPFQTLLGLGWGVFMCGFVSVFSMCWPWVLSSVGLVYGLILCLGLVWSKLRLTQSSGVPLANFVGVGCVHACWFVCCLVQLHGVMSCVDGIDGLGVCLVISGSDMPWAESW